MHWFELAQGEYRDVCRSSLIDLGPDELSEQIRLAVVGLTASGSLVLEAGNRVSLAKILGEQWHGEVKLSAAWCPDDPLLNEAVSVY